MRATDEYAKLTETYSVKITYKQKILMGQSLSKSDLAELAEFIRIEIAKRIHMKNFNPSDYMAGEILGEETAP